MERKEHERDDEPRHVKCKYCHGTGWHLESPNKYVTVKVGCIFCRGEGWVVRYGLIVRGED